MFLAFSDANLTKLSASFCWLFLNFSVKALTRRIETPPATTNPTASAMRIVATLIFSIIILVFQFIALVLFQLADQVSDYG
ncbi:MAG: hypothetical protein ACD_34C00585G0004 [uncultured bacterium]|nr:MAG: hypothetical protein ACD_34C00585G0004 [uncultured bacterium]